MSELYDDARADQAANKREEPIDKLEKARDYLRDSIEEWFADQYGNAWAYYHDGPRLRFYEVESQPFKDWVRVRVNHLAGKPREPWVEPIVKLFASEARRSGERELYLRRANIEGEWYLQVSDDTALRITKGNIERIDAGTTFRNFGHQHNLSIDLDASIDDINLLDKYVNILDHNERELFKTTLVAYGIPSIAKPIQLTRGPAGSAKSTLSRLTKYLFDPSIAKMGIAYPKDERDWEVNCREHDIVLLDNLNKLSKEQQDECCRIITGKSSTRRKLYTDRESYVTTLKATLLINAIDLTNLNSDFLDRAFIWELARIAEENRIADEDFWSDFGRDAPRIRGAIVKIIAQAQVTKVEPSIIPQLRLKDFARYAMACAMVRGIAPDTFAKWVLEKIELQKDESIAQSPLLEPLVKFMQDKTEWTGTASDLLKQLTAQEYGEATGDEHHERMVVKHTPPSWFKTAEAIGTEIARTSFLWERLGLKYTFHRTKRKRTLIIQNIERFAVTPSPNTTLLTTKEGDEGGYASRHPSVTLSPDGCQVTAGCQRNSESRHPNSSDGEPLKVTEMTAGSENFSILKGEKNE